MCSSTYKFDIERTHLGPKVQLNSIYNASIPRREVEGILHNTTSLAAIPSLFISFHVSKIPVGTHEIYIYIKIW